jgi:GNAT superfamily N-acetyltransferase
MRRAELTDVETLVEFMAEFYAESGYQLDRSRAASAFTDVIRDERLGAVWVLGDRAGHAVVTVRYAMEYGGMIACLDDLYVRPEWRRRGLAHDALHRLTKWCVAIGLRAITVEVGVENEAALGAYRQAGFVECAGRAMLAMELAAPAHVVAG